MSGMLRRRRAQRRRPTGEQALRLAMEREHCRCGGPATITRTDQEGKIQRTCLSCLAPH